MQPKLDIPREVHIVPPLSTVRSLFGSGVCNSSSGSASFVPVALPQVVGSGNNENWYEYRRTAISPILRATLEGERQIG